MCIVWCDVSSRGREERGVRVRKSDSGAEKKENVNGPIVVKAETAVLCLKWGDGNGVTGERE